MLMRKLLTAALSVLLVTFALTPTALATEETSATPESDVDHSVCLHQPGKYFADHFSKWNCHCVWVCAKNTGR
ncbi:MAG: hypothetical protein ACOX1Y_14365 [Zhaonellaceae bacterium]